MEQNQEMYWKNQVQVDTVVDQQILYKMKINLKDKNIKWLIIRGSGILLFVAIIAFGYFNTLMITRGVKLTASIDKTGSSPLVYIKGNAKNATYLALNGREIFIDKDGAFTEPVALLPGLSVVTLEAQDKFGKNAEKKFEIVYNENNQVALINK
jgi:hypothetical protein